MLAVRWGRRKREAVTPAHATGGPVAREYSSHDVTLAETVARHHAGATVEGRTARLGDLGVDIECVVQDIRETAGQSVAVLSFWISGGHLFREPTYASASGYHADPIGAIVEGGCLWSCTFVPVLRLALNQPATADEVDAFETTIGGQRCRVALGALDRQMSMSGKPETSIADARARLAGGQWLTQVVLASDTLPILPPGPTLLSVFVGEAPVGTTVEVKVNGGDWAPAKVCWSDQPGPDARAINFCREIALVVPLEAPPALQRTEVQRTLAGIAGITSGPWSATWLGWQTHVGRLQPPLTKPELQTLESATGLLPDDYRAFLTRVAGAGAGPGYGLLPPERTGDHIVLAHAGCGVTWRLRLEGPQRGTVWVEASGSDERYERVADSFDAWYRSWLDNAVRDAGPWLHWDPNCCATAGILRQLLDQAEERTGQRPDDLGAITKTGGVRITLTSGGGALPSGANLDPCQGCVTLAHQFGLDADVFTPGVLRRVGDQ